MSKSHRKINAESFTDTDLFEAQIEDQMLEMLPYDLIHLEPSKRIRLRAALHSASRRIRKELRGIAKELYEQKRKILIDLAVSQIQSLIDRV
jgi:hypothetical protein